VTATPVKRRLAILATALFVALGLSTVDALPASAAGVGYVRLAHLSPDAPAVDVYLTSVSGAIAPKTFPAVAYGVVSAYLTLPVGTYTVAMRGAGASPSDPALLSATVTVVAGHAYTVAGVGRYVGLGLRIIADDLALPGSGKAKVRVVQASVKAPMLTVSVVGGPVIKTNVAFATTTGYQQVNPGRWTLRLQPAGGGAATTVSANLAPNGVYSLIVLDGLNGLTTELRTDAKGGSTVPRGGVETGAGGGRGTQPAPALVGLSVLMLAGVGFVTWRVRRVRLRSREL
jgi:hypothetical protein